MPVELHIYAGSGHGFGLRANDPKPTGKWIERFEEWLADSKFLGRLSTIDKTKMQQRGNVNENLCDSGGADELHDAGQLQSFLYAA